MILKIIASLVIFFASCMGVFFCMGLVAGMQMKVAVTAYENKEICTALIYAKKAVSSNPTELAFRVDLQNMRNRYHKLKEEIFKQQK